MYEMYLHSIQIFWRARYVDKFRTTLKSKVGLFLVTSDTKF